MRPANRRRKSLDFSHYDQQVAKRMDPHWDWTREHMQLVLPFYHNFGFTTTLICLMAGSTGVIIRKYEPTIFLQTIQDYHVCSDHFERFNFVDSFDLYGPSDDFTVGQEWFGSAIWSFQLNFYTDRGSFNISSNSTASQIQAAPISREIIETVQRRLPNIKQISQGYGRVCV